MIEKLYRVVPTADWEYALVHGFVPRCPADERGNRVHLNELKDVERVANMWFSCDEAPIVLEVCVGHMSESLRWERRTDEPCEVWPNLYVKNIPRDAVSRVFELNFENFKKGLPRYKLGKVLTERDAS